MSEAAEDPGAGEDLPEAFVRVLTDYERHLAVERNLSAHTVRAYLGDLVSLLDHLGIEKAVFCGHDWGGLIVWQMPLMHPDRCAGIIGLNTPFLRRGPFDPIAGMRMAFGEDMYIVWFQKPGEADKALAADVDKTMRFFMRKPAAIQAG